MNKLTKSVLSAAISLALLGITGAAHAAVNVQCPGDQDGDAAWDSPQDKAPGSNNGPSANTKCMHLIAGDSFSVMSDGNPMYMFGFGDQTGTPPADVIGNGGAFGPQRFVHALQHVGVGVTEIDGEEDLARDGIPRIGAHLHHADRRAGIGKIGHTDPVDRVDHA